MESVIYIAHCSAFYKNYEEQVYLYLHTYVYVCAYIYSTYKNCHVGNMVVISNAYSSSTFLQCSTSKTKFRNTEYLLVSTSYEQLCVELLISHLCRLQSFLSETIAWDTLLGEIIKFWCRTAWLNGTVTRLRSDTKIQRNSNVSRINIDTAVIYIDYIIIIGRVHLLQLGSRIDYIYAYIHR